LIGFAAKPQNLTAYNKPEIHAKSNTDPAIQNKPDLLNLHFQNLDLQTVFWFG
jgi:hypothetical protein